MLPDAVRSRAFRSAETAHSGIGVSLVLLSQACGSEEPKKKAQGPSYMGQGDGGDPSGGSDATGKAAATAPTQPPPDKPTVKRGPGDGCEPGFGECDGNPETVCEQNLNLVTSCGAGPATAVAVREAGPQLQGSGERQEDS